MLASLHITNYALIESLDVTFDAGLSIITGETGAGKSIVIDALGLLLGERSSSDAVRTGADKAVVEGTFSGAAVAVTMPLLERLDIDRQPELVVRREVSAKGQTRCFINDTPVPVTALKELGDALVDLHGQHEHQSLLRADTHITMLDAFAGVERNHALYRTTYSTWRERVGELVALRKRQTTLRERAAIVAHQLADIDAIAPQQGEDEAITRRLALAEHAEQVHALTSELGAMLYDGENAVHDVLSHSLQRLEALAQIDPAFTKWREECEGARAAIDELATFVRRYHEQVEFDPESLEDQRSRLFALNALRRKYGGTLDAVIAHRAELAAERDAAENFDDDCRRAEQAVAEERTRCAAAAQRLSAMRARACPGLERAIVGALRDLGIPSAVFTVAIGMSATVDSEDSLLIDGAPVAAGPNGIDTVEFLISTNSGEPVKPLVKVASGGEVSRVMLALKSALAAADKTPVLVFDEIDVGISGRIAEKVGAAMRTLGAHHQVIAITHLPQIAGFARAHYTVEKIQTKGATRTNMRRLTDDERVRAVAALVSGEDITAAGLENARELIRRGGA